MLHRRRFLKAALAASLAPLVGRCRRSEVRARWDAGARRKQSRSRVAVLEARSYDGRLADVVLQGVRLFDLDVQGRRVVLKPNLVEHDPLGVINTHPAVVVAALEAFRTLGAREVIVAEGPGHRRDTEHLLVASGLHHALREYRAPYVDLNQDRVRSVPLGSHYTRFERLYLPETVLGADLLVSMPKLKTHHWAGVTLSMKNLFGVIPGAVYGWPKNALHWNGIQASIVDINSSLRMPRFAILDGIVGMEGNGPIQGEPKPTGVLLFGDDPVAVDATATRLMGIEPRRIPYLLEADRFLGNLERRAIDPIGEPLEAFQQDFALLERFASLKRVES